MEFRNRTDAVDLQQTRAATCDVDDTLARSTHFLGYFLIFTSTSRDLSTESNLLCAVSLPIDSLDPMWLPEVRTHASRMTRHQLQSTDANPSKNVNGNNHNTIRTNTHKHNPAARQFCSPSPVGCRYDYYYLRALQHAVGNKDLPQLPRVHVRVIIIFIIAQVVLAKYHASRRSIDIAIEADQAI